MDFEKKAGLINFKASKSLQVQRKRTALKRDKDTAHLLTYRLNRENASSFFVFHFASGHLVLNFSSGSDYHCDSRHGGYRAPRTICDRGGDGCRGIHKYERQYISELRSSIPKSDVWRLDTTRLRASSCINLGWPGWPGGQKAEDYRHDRALQGQTNNTDLFNETNTTR